MQLMKALALFAVVASSEACAELGAHCSLWNGCCGGLHCTPEGLLNWRCREQCVAEGQTCGGPGLADRSCCDGMKCERHLLGTSNKQCVRPQPQCVSQGQICGCTGCLTQDCCDGSTCSEVSGQGGKRHCVNIGMNALSTSIEENSTVLLQQEELQHCVAEGRTCGGPGLADLACCDGMKCERHLLGTSNKQCVRPQPQCVSQGQICGCTGCLTQDCCDGSTCSEVSGQGGKLYCVNLMLAAEAASTDVNNTDGILMPHIMP